MIFYEELDTYTVEHNCIYSKALYSVFEQCVI